MLRSDQKLVRRARVVVNRLERLSADSSYAHQASGLRGAIMHQLRAWDLDEKFQDMVWIQILIERAEEILVAAAGQIPEQE